MPQQLMMSLFGASVNQMLQQQQQQSLPLDSLRQAWQTALSPQLNNPQSLQHRNAQPPVATNAAVSTTGHDAGIEEEKSETEEEESS